MGCNRTDLIGFIAQRRIKDNCGNHNPWPGFYASKNEMELKIGKYLIRDWRTRDSSSIAKYANNKNIWANLRDGFPHPYQLSDAERFLSYVAQQNPRTIFAIADNKEAIGSIGLMLGEDVHRFTAEMGYWLAEPFWNKGIMSTCKQNGRHDAYS